MAEQWWTDEDVDRLADVMPHGWLCRCDPDDTDEPWTDPRCRPLVKGSALAALAALTPTVERIKRGAAAEEREWWRSHVALLTAGAHARGESERRRALLDLLALDERREPGDA